MQSRIFQLLFVFTAGILYTSPTWPQQEGMRILALNGNWPETLSIDVTIFVDGEAGNFAAVETPPSDWTVSNIRPTGEHAEGVITWNSSVRRPGLPRTLTYTVAIPSLSEQAGFFQGTINNIPIAGISSFTPSKINPGVQTPVKSSLKYNYLVYLPSSYERRQKPYPLLLFLHGAGERGTNLNLVKTHGPPKIVESPTSMQSLFGNDEFPFILISPQCPSGWWWENVPLHDLMNEVLKNHDVDPSRIYLTGLSMGGFGIWSYASEYPEQVAAVLPIAGGSGDGTVFWNIIRTYTSHLEDLKPANPETLVGIPIWSFHGDSDPTVPISLDRDIVNRVNSLGGNVKFTVYPGVGHDSWTQTYNNLEIYQWLLSQTKQGESEIMESSLMH